MDSFCCWFLFKLLFFNCGIVDLQYYISFRCIAQWFSYTHTHTHTHTHIYIIFFQILFPCKLLQNIEYSSLCYIVGPCWLSIYIHSHESESCSVMSNSFATTWTVCSLSGSSVHGIFQARILEWIAISFSRGSSWPRHRTGVSCIAGRFYTISATREAIYSSIYLLISIS